MSKETWKEKVWGNMGRDRRSFLVLIISRSPLRDDDHIQMHIHILKLKKREKMRKEENSTQNLLNTLGTF